MSSIPGLPDFSGVDALYAGLILSTCFLGITILQSWNYGNHNRDSWGLRSFVALLVACDVWSTVATAIYMHTYLPQHLGDFTTVSTSLVVETVVTTTTIFFVQVFFASRVYLLNRKNYWLPGAICLAGLVGLGFSYLGAATLTIHNKLTDVARPFVKISIIVNMSLSMISDSITTVCLCLNFIRARSGSQVKRTNNILQDLVSITIRRGLLVTIADLVFLIMYLASLTGLNWLAVNFVLSKLYVITMIAILNARPSAKSDAHARSTEIATFDVSTTIQERGSVTSRLHPPEFALQSFQNKDLNSVPNDSKKILITQETSVV